MQEFMGMVCAVLAGGENHVELRKRRESLATQPFQCFCGRDSVASFETRGSSAALCNQQVWEGSCHGQVHHWWS